jgi:NitT/TauT family transport system substrate-binding protein
MSTAVISNSDNTGMGRRGRRVGAVSGMAVLALAAAACGSSSSSSAATAATTATTATSTASSATTLATSATTAAAGGASVTVHVGYFPNLTHAVALVGVNEGILAKDLAPDKLDSSQTFTAGPAENQALLAGSIDIAFEGPSSAVSAYHSSKGAVSIIAGSASGGAALVVKSSITSAAELKGATLASPQLANTQDVALKYWLKTQNLSSSVTVQPSTTGNGTIVTEFKAKAIDGAWVPEPYVAEMVAAGGHILVNEKSLWPNGQFSTTEVVVRNAFLKAHPATVARFLTGLSDTLAAIKSDPTAAQTAANAQLVKIATKALPTAVLTSGWADLSFTLDPLESSVVTQTAHAVAIGELKNPGDISGLFNLAPLNQVLTAKGQPTISS